MPAIPVENLKTMEVWFGLSNEDALKKVGDLATLLGHNADEYRKAFIERKEAFEKAEAARKLRERQAELVKAINGQGLEDVDVALIVEAVKSGVRISIGTELNPDGQDIPVLEAGSTAPGATRTRGPLVSTGSRSPQQFQYFYNGMPLEPGERLSRHILANHEDSVAAAALKAYKDKPNKSKLGAWEAVQRDPDLSKLYTREPKASAQGDIPEDSILEVANAIRDERRQSDVQHFNQRRVDYSSREILAIVGEDPDTQELSMGDVEHLARLALETDAAEGQMTELDRKKWAALLRKEGRLIVSGNWTKFHHASRVNPLHKAIVLANLFNYGTFNS